MQFCSIRQTFLVIPLLVMLESKTIENYLWIFDHLRISVSQEFRLNPLFSWEFRIWLFDSQEIWIRPPPTLSSLFQDLLFVHLFLSYIYSCNTSHLTLNNNQSSYNIICYCNLLIKEPKCVSNTFFMQFLLKILAPRVIKCMFYLLKKPKINYFFFLFTDFNVYIVKKHSGTGLC